MGIEFSNNIYDYFSNLYGKDAADNYLSFIDKEPTQYIRVNHLKIDNESLAKLLSKKYLISVEVMTGFPNALKVIKDENKLIGKTLEQILGLYYIQGLSSMLPPLVLQPTKAEKVLDLCSAPGSKTTQMSEMMNNEGTLVVNEIELDRIKSLVFNIDRMSVINTGVIHSKGEILSKYYNNYFDKILVDAPCSGLGIIQKKEEVNKWWSLDRVSRLKDLQLRLLVAAIKMAKVGGEIVYSTCTLSVEENELVLDKVLSKYPIELEEINLPIKTREAILEYDGNSLNSELKKAVRILPWEIDSDGFFMVKIRKIAESAPAEKGDYKKTNIVLWNYDHKEMLPLLKHLSEHFGIPMEIFSKYKFIPRGRDIYFINDEWEVDQLELFHRVGLKFGTMDKKGRITFYTSAAQVLADHITKHVHDISEMDDLKNYFMGWKIRNTELPKGQYVIRNNNLVLGTAIVGDDGIKSRFPRSKRTQNFVIQST